MQFDGDGSAGFTGRHSAKVECPHSSSRELLLIGLVVALGILVALVIVVPALVTG